MGHTVSTYRDCLDYEVFSKGMIYRFFSTGFTICQFEPFKHLRIKP